jgi:two-component system, OmpR family, phosphate regulon sensor histidine kinase PhoR
MKRPPPLVEPSEPSSDQEHDLQRASDFNALLVGMAGHDLRQPLQIIQSTYEWLSGRLAADAEKAWLRRGELAATMLTQQLDHLVDGVRLHDQSTKMTFAPVPLAPLLDRVRNEGVELTRKKWLDLRIRPTRAVVVSNGILLEGIVRNLVRNAIKYTPESGRVLIACRRRGADIRIDVFDTGIGMSADQIPRIFKAFERLDSTKPDGLGLGLFVVRRAVELLGHRIEVSSTVGRGTRFSVLAKSATLEEPS